MHQTSFDGKSMNLKKCFDFGIMALTLLGLAACAPTIANRGNILHLSHGSRVVDQRHTGGETVVRLDFIDLTAPVLHFLTPSN
jgi:hypothetical protein